MFGKNVIRKSELDLPGTTLAVQEIFETIQGEGPQAGRPCVFVRLAGCNLACTFCDTEFESGINNRMGLEVLAAHVEARRYCELVVLTGGEPLRQNVTPLLQRWLKAGTVKMVQVETAGTLFPPDFHKLFDYRDWGTPFLQLVCSPKTPKVHVQIEERCNHFKYVVKAGEPFSEVDGLPMWSTQKSGELAKLYRPPKGRTIWVSPCDEYETDKNAANLKHAVDLCMRYGYRLSLQQHKIINMP